jgi:hypothetical protein
MEEQKNVEKVEGSITDVLVPNYAPQPEEIVKWQHINFGRYDYIPREYTVAMIYNTITKKATYGIAISHPELDQFRKSEGRRISLLAAHKNPFLTVDFLNLVAHSKSSHALSPKKEMKVVGKHFRFVATQYIDEIMFECFINK